MRLNPRTVKALSLTALSSLVLAACGGTSSPGSSNGNLAQDQTLKFPLLGDFGSLDPGVFDAETDSEIAQNLFSGVVKFDDNLNVVCDLCSELPSVSSDGLTYTFKLRKDATFWNGDKVTADDVLFSWNRAAALGNSYAGNFAPVVGYDVTSKNKLAGKDLEASLESGKTALSGLKKTDDYTVTAKLTAPAGYFVTSLALVSTGWIVDRKVVATDPDNWWTKPETLVGSGPYKMSARVPKQSVDFVSVDNWWGSPKPVIKKIHNDILDSATTAVQKYDQGGYDIVGYGGWSNLPVDDVLREQQGPKKAELHLQPKVRSYWVSFNMLSDSKRAAKGPFTGNSGTGNDLRKAFALAIDKAKLATVVCRDIVCTAATGGLINKGLKGYLGDNADPLGKFDAATAKSLLTKADPTGSLTKGLVYTYDPNSPLNKPTAENLQEQWSTNLGVKVDIQPVDHSTFIKARLKGGYVLSRDGWQADYNHPQDWFDNLWGTNAGGADGTTAGYVNPAYDALLKKADAESLDTALPDYKKLSQMLIDDVVYIPLYYSVGSFLFKPYVKGVGTNNFFDHYWNELSIAQH
ncbi:MAG: peptide ABC transporter substrate-binding protein [Candidatus Dormibacteria bacterium]